MPVIPARWEAEVRRLRSQAGPRQNCKIISDKLLKENGLGWWHNSRGRIPAQQAQGLEFNPSMEKKRLGVNDRALA
jgi:hypothetical protein